MTRVTAGQINDLSVRLEGLCALVRFVQSDAEPFADVRLAPAGMSSALA